MELTFLPQRCAFCRLRVKWLILFFPSLEGFWGTWRFRAAHGNTGMLYALDDMGYGVATWGPVCQGNRKEALTGRNGQRFGQLVCSEMGYGPDSLKYFGLKTGYFLFMENADRTQDCSSGGFEKSQHLDELPCLPEYKICGGFCSKHDESINQCSVRDFRTEGGSCLRGVTEMYIHCQLPSSTTVGSWSEWQGEDSYCDPREDYYIQRHRKCENLEGDQSQSYWCPGPWLELLNCGSCPKEAEENEDYNEHYYQATYRDQGPIYYSDSVYDDSSEKRKRRSADICNCTLHTNYFADCENLIGTAGIHTWMYLAMAIAVITGLIFVLIYAMKKRQEQLIKYQRGLADNSRKNTIKETKLNSESNI